MGSRIAALLASVAWVALAADARADDYLSDVDRPARDPALAAPPRFLETSRIAEEARTRGNLARQALDFADTTRRRLEQFRESPTAPGSPEAKSRFDTFQTESSGAAAAARQAMEELRKRRVPLRTSPPAAAASLQAQSFADGAAALEAIQTYADVVENAPLLERLVAESASAMAMQSTVEYYATGAAVAAERRRAFSLDDLNAAGFTLRRAYGEPADKQGATFVYTRDYEEDTEVFTSEYCLKWTKILGGASACDRVRLQPVVAAFGNLTTENADDTYGYGFLAGLGAKWDWSPTRWSKHVDRTTRRLYTDATLHYLRSQTGNIEKLFGELLVTPVHGPWGLGVRRGHESIDRATGRGIDARGCCIPPRNFVSAQWDVNAVLDVGTVLEAADGVEEGEILAAEVTVRGVLYFDWIARNLFGRGFDSTTYPLLDVAYTARWMPTQDLTYVDTFEVIGKVPITKYIGFQVGYTKGAKGPSLEDVDRLEMALTFGF